VHNCHASGAPSPSHRSLAVLGLVLVIESEFGIEVADTDLEPANFATIARIAAFIDAHR
jgi:acyl carrier protein